MLSAAVLNCNATSYANAIRNLCSLVDIKQRHPTGEYVRNASSNVDPDTLLEDFRKSTEFCIREMKRQGQISKRVFVAIDKHDIPRYDKKSKDELKRGQSKKDTTKFETYITIQAVNQKFRQVLGVIRVSQGDSNAKLIRKLLLCPDLGIKPYMILLDREFHSTEVMNEFDRLNMSYIIPCVNRSTVVKILCDYDKGTIKPVKRTAIKNSNGLVVTHYALITKRTRKRKKKEEDEEQPEEKYIAFVSNVPWADVRKYGMRWGIETGYRMIERVRPKTKSTNEVTRIFLFLCAVIVYNLWSVVNVVISRAEWDGKPVLTQLSFMIALQYFIPNKTEPEPPP